jgi:hypothetical protein
MRRPAFPYSSCGKCVIVVMKNVRVEWGNDNVGMCFPGPDFTLPMIYLSQVLGFKLWAFSILWTLGIKKAVGRC